MVPWSIFRVTVSWLISRNFIVAILNNTLLGPSLSSHWSYLFHLFLCQKQRKAFGEKQNKGTCDLLCGGVWVRTLYLVLCWIPVYCVLLETGGWVIDSLREATLIQKVNPSLPWNTENWGLGN